MKALCYIKIDDDHTLEWKVILKKPETQFKCKGILFTVYFPNFVFFFQIPRINKIVLEYIFIIFCPIKKNFRLCVYKTEKNISFKYTKYIHI